MSTPPKTTACRPGQTIAIDSYTVRPTTVHDGIAEIDVKSRATDGQTLFQNLERQVFLRLPKERRFSVGCGGPTSGAWQALETYLLRLRHPAPLPTDPGNDEYDDGCAGAIRAYLDDAGFLSPKDRTHAIARPEWWAEYFQGLAKAAGGTIDRSRIVATAAAAIRAAVMDNVRHLQEVRRSGETIDAVEQWQTAHLCGLAKRWGLTKEARQLSTLLKQTPTQKIDASPR